MGFVNEISKCPSCGHDNFDPEIQCICGYHADESFIVESFIMESGSNNNQNEEEVSKRKSLKNIVKPKADNPSEIHTIKEIDSWVFSFSPNDNCIFLGTPALKSFKLKLTLKDIEELIEIMYKKTGHDKTFRKLQLSAKNITDLTDKVHTIIEEKRSKIDIKFSNDELQEIANLINTKLKA